MSGPGSTRSVWLVVGGTIGLILLAILVRVTIESKLSFDAGTVALRENDREGAVFHFRSAARWYFPGNPWVGSSLDQLVAIAVVATAEQDWKLAVHAYDSARAAILGTRSFYTPNQRRLREINASLPDVLWNARITHEHGPKPSPGDEESLKRFFAERLQTDHAPNMFWSVVLCIGFLGWMVGTFFAVRLGFSNDGRVDKSALFRFGGLALTGFALWLGGLFLL